jgi:hypothetical protein
MNEIAAYGGFPVRYPHWRFGMEYEQLSKSYEYGLSKIYELVINNNPAIAYLLEGNSLVDQKLVMAHVYGHCDFFKNNFCFQIASHVAPPPEDDRRDGQPWRAHRRDDGSPRVTDKVEDVHRRLCQSARQPDRSARAPIRAAEDPPKARGSGGPRARGAVEDRSPSS